MVLALPHEPGRYRVFLSMMREHVAWFWEKGWPFVLTDAWVDDESQGRLGKTRVATTRRLKGERTLRALRLAVTLPFETIWTNRSLIHSMTRRDILGRYRGSFGGATWAVLNPLLLMLTYFFIFGVVLQQKFNPERPAHRLRALLPRRHAALAGLQRGRGTLAHDPDRISQFHQEAALSRWRRCRSTSSVRGWSRNASGW